MLFLLCGEDMISNNCCSFAAAFCKELGVGDIFPAWIDRWARLLASVKMPVDKGLDKIARVSGMVKEGRGAKKLREKIAKHLLPIMLLQKP